jgi:tetratricopeptide (TPR) repeat protein
MNSMQSELGRGWKLHQQKRIAEAEQVYRKVLSVEPHNANGWCYLGMALNDQRKYLEAVEAYEKAISIEASFPVALNNLGNSLRYLGEIQRADDCFQKAIDLQPDYFNAHKNRGTLHAWAGDSELALTHYSRALSLKPDDAELHRNLGVIHLLHGRFTEGWMEYRWRWRVGDLHRIGSIPVWEGSDPGGKSFVLTAEQGLGDTFQFARFAKLLREKGARTLISCPPKLLALMQQSSDLGPVYPNNLPLPQKFDYQCSLLDIADLLGVDLQSIPSLDGYIRPASNLADYWSRRIPRNSDKLRVGITWQGNPNYQADCYRSMPLSYFEPLSRVDGVQLVSLQQGHGIEQLAAWKGQPIIQFEDGLDTSSGAFMDTAAIICNLDLIVTCDTAIGHLAAAMGVPTWIALSYIPDWRWLLDRSDSPWYPSVRLFRQPKPGDWQSAFDLIAAALVELQSQKTVRIGHEEN